MTSSTSFYLFYISLSLFHFFVLCFLCLVTSYICYLFHNLLHLLCFVMSLTSCYVFYILFLFCLVTSFAFSFIFYLYLVVLHALSQLFCLVMSFTSCYLFYVHFHLVMFLFCLVSLSCVICTDGYMEESFFWFYFPIISLDVSKAVLDHAKMKIINYPSQTH